MLKSADTRSPVLDGLQPMDDLHDDNVAMEDAFAVSPFTEQSALGGKSQHRIAKEDRWLHGRSPLAPSLAPTDQNPETD